MFGSTLAFNRNVEREYERNSERYALLRWGQQAFSDSVWFLLARVLFTR